MVRAGGSSSAFFIIELRCDVIGSAASHMEQRSASRLQLHATCSFSLSLFLPLILCLLLSSSLLFFASVSQFDYPFFAVPFFVFISFLV
jgi:hypothetical protein